MRVCPACGERNPDRFRLCGSCGTPFAAPVRPEVRKTVTIVFCDLKGSTDLGERLDTESLREVLALYFERMKAVLESHGGTVEKFIGDAVMAVFGLPRLHEEDALRAVRAAHEMRHALVELNHVLERRWAVRLENRTGVNTGEVVAGDVATGHRLVTGDAVNVAARLEQAAPAMEVLIGASTYRLVKDAVEVEAIEPMSLKGKAEPVPAYRLLGVTKGEGYARRTDTPMVGRREELGRLDEAFERTGSARHPEVMTILAAAGVGKSRLLAEFRRELVGRADVLRGRCLPYGEGITFWPLAEVAREAGAISEDEPVDVARAKLEALVPGEPRVAARVAAAIGLSEESFPVEELFWGFRRLLEALAAARPLVVFFDDIHWAEPTFLELLRHVVDTASDAPLLLVCSARPEMLEEHPDWLLEAPGVGSLRLEPLSPEDSAEVVANLLGSVEVDESVRRRVIEAAEGNPLFVEQMLSMLIDEGVLRADEAGVWGFAVPAESIAIPPTISALLSARLDRLAIDERAVIERGAVIGKIFYEGAVAEMAPEEIQDQVGLCLVSLVQKGLIVPDESTFAGEDAFRFAHILIRDAAYNGLLKRTRAGLHEKFVDWLERVAGSRIHEYEEICGYHLEQSYLAQTELTQPDEQALALALHAAGYLGSAGRRASGRGDMPAAGGLLGRAVALLPEGDVRRAAAQLDLGEVKIELGEFAEAASSFEGSASTAEGAGDRGLAATAEIMQLQLRYTTDPEESEEEVVRRVHEAIALLEDVEYHRGLARAWRLLGIVHGTACRFGDAERAGIHVIEHARRAGEQQLEVQARAPLALCAVYGPTTVPEARRRCEQLLVEASGDRKAEAMLMTALAHLAAMEGSFDEARSLYRRSRGMLEELGFRHATALTSLDSGSVEMLAGDLDAAESELRGDYEALEEMGERNYISTTAALLAEVLYRQGRFEESERLVDVSSEVAAPDDTETQVLWRCIRAKLLARAGEQDEAEPLVEEAVRLIGKTDELDSQGNALMDLAEVLRAGGRAAEAGDAVEEAAKLYEQKGNVVSLRRATALLERT